MLSHASRGDAILESLASRNDWRRSKIDPVQHVEDLTLSQKVNTLAWLTSTVLNIADLQRARTSPNRLGVPAVGHELDWLAATPLYEALVDAIVIDQLRAVSAERLRKNPRPAVTA